MTVSVAIKYTERTFQYLGGTVRVQPADVSRGQIQQNLSRPYYFSRSLVNICNCHYFRHPNGSFKTLPGRTICACLGDVWRPVVWPCSCSVAGKSFCLSPLCWLVTAQHPCKTALDRVRLNYTLLMQPMFRSQQEFRAYCAVISTAIASAASISCCLKLGDRLPPHPPKRSRDVLLGYQIASMGTTHARAAVTTSI